MRERAAKELLGDDQAVLLGIGDDAGLGGGVGGGFVAVGAEYRRQVGLGEFGGEAVGKEQAVGAVVQPFSPAQNARTEGGGRAKPVAAGQKGGGRNRKSGKDGAAGKGAGLFGGKA